MTSPGVFCCLVSIFIIRMKFHKNRLLTTVAAVALVLAVGACSSSSDDDSISAERDTALEELKAANAKVTRLEGELETANGMVTDLEGQLETANGMVTDLETLIGDEMNPDPASVRGMLAQANLDLADARTALQMAMDEAKADDMEIDRLTKAVTAAEGMRDNYMTMLTAANVELEGDADAEGLKAKVTKLESELKTANDRIAEIEKKAADDMVADDAKDASDKAAEVLKALETLSGTLPTIKVSASSDNAFAATAAGYTMSDTLPEAISGFRGRILTKDRAEALVYTDIENAVATAIGDIYDSSSGPGEPDVYGVFATVDEDTNTDDIPWSAVKRADDKSATTGAGDTAKTTFAGSVRGLAGTFSCTGQNCNPPVPDTDGAVTSGEVWTFVPTVANGTIDIADGAPESKADGYVQFGWWLNQKGKDVDDGFNVRTFASATGYAAIDTPLSGTVVEGSATYTGGAAGKWAIASTTEDTTEGGHFTATATLGVDFDADFTPDTDENDKMGVSISGSITDFMTGNVSRPNWNVTLTLDNDETAMGVQHNNELTAMVAGTTKWTTGGAVDGTGAWTGNFHGSEKVTTHPMAVVGTFDAEIGGGAIGRIRGAYGATK